jgi:hypothetical protein
MTELSLVMSFIRGLQLKMWNIVMAAVKVSGKSLFVLIAFVVLSLRRGFKLSCFKSVICLKPRTAKLLSHLPEVLRQYFK